MRKKRLLTSTWQTSLAYNQMLGQNVINTFWFERPLWVAVDPFTAEEEAPEVEEFIYHRPVLESEALELLEPKPGSLIVDATCGGGGHTEAFLESGANVLALDRDPDAIQHVSEQLARFGKRLAVRQANFRCAISVLDELGIRTIGGALLDIGVSSRQLENSERGFSFMRNGPLDMRMDPRGAADCRCDRKRVQRGATDAVVSRVGRGAGSASHREPDCKDAKECTVSRDSAAGASD